MQKEILNQISELQIVHKELTRVIEKENEILVSGSLPFEASAEGFESISECFDIELVISVDYPEILPSVRETGQKIDGGYEHINESGTLCLGVPIEERRLFLEQPSLLGFVNRLLIPYLFGYCYWKQNKTHPFDEYEHGTKGIVQYYIENFGLDDEISVLAVISYVYEHGLSRSPPLSVRKRKEGTQVSWGEVARPQRTTFRLYAEARFHICFGSLPEKGRKGANRNF